MNKYLKTIELDKILEQISEETCNEDAKQIILSLQPSSNINEVKKSIFIIDEALKMSLKYGSPSFIKIHNIIDSVNRAKAGSSLSLKEIINVRTILYQTKTLKFWRNEAEEFDSEIEYFFDTLTENKYLEEKIKESILDEDEIADTASVELGSIRRKIINQENKIRSSLEKITKSTSTSKYLQESIVTIRDGRYVVPVKSEYKNEINGFVHDTSSTGSTLFIEPVSVIEANNEIRILKGKEKDEIARIIAVISSEIADFGDALIQNYNLCIELDVIFAKSNFALKINAIAPEIVDTGCMYLNKARHPLINKEDVVPINLEIGNDFDTLIITGPNTGGKTVALKTAGLLTAMTMCGLLIPVSEGSVISVFDKILVDIGDKQSIEQNLSTFSSHMNNVIEILSETNDSSLVLLDELGSGTDPIEGAALAISIISSLIDKNVKLITSTHYQELKMFALKHPRVQNASCEFDVKSLKPTYKILMGHPGKSNAFAISQRLGLSEKIISEAKLLINQEDKKFDAVMDELEQKRLEAEKLNSELFKLKNSLSEEKDKFQNERDLFFKQKESELAKARNEAMRIVRKVTDDSQKLLDELELIRKEKNKESFNSNSIKAKSTAKNVLNKLYNVANPVTDANKDYKLPRKLIKGDSVIIVETKKVATVLTEPDNSGNLFIQVGIMKTKINVNKLRLTEKQNISFNNSKITTSGVESKKTRKVKSELDIRGYASDEGIIEVDSYLDNAVMTGLNIVTIIHGKGTGVLRDNIRSHLKRHKLVKSYRRGMYGEGEDGVTVVELK